MKRDRIGFREAYRMYRTELGCEPLTCAFLAMLTVIYDCKR